MPGAHVKTARETERARAAFDAYCTLGIGRSLLKLARALKASPDWSPPVPVLSTLEHWSAAYGWQERAREYDAAKADEQARRRERAIEAMNRRQAKIGREQTERAIGQIQALIEAKAFGSQAAVQLLKLATDLERTARGAPATVERHELTGKDGGAIEVLDARDILAARLAALAERQRTPGTAGEPDA